MNKTIYAESRWGIYRKARELRRYATPAEEALWDYLRSRPMGFKFRRKHPYFGYLLDFYCPKLKLVIQLEDETDEFESLETGEKLRQNLLERNGVLVLGFTNEQILTQLEEVISEIVKYLET